MQLSKQRRLPNNPRCVFQLGVGGGWGERQEQLGVVCITVVRESMNPCDVIAEPSDVVYSENRSGPNTGP